jgi:uncharacterized LabA/DUF88 family protein
MKKQSLKLKGKTAVFIDWANVYHWNKVLKNPVNPEKLYQYLNKYHQIKEINFYFGEDNNQKSKSFLQKVKSIGFRVITKKVKYIIVGKVSDTLVKQRKCDFDIEICMDVYRLLEKGYESFVFFSGDGDFTSLYKFLIKKGKQVLVIFEKGFLGKEVWEVDKGIFKTRLSYLL